MKKVLKIVGILIGSLVILAFASFIYLNEGQPEVEYTTEADSLAYEMLDALNKPAWDSTQYVQWTFRNNHKYLWDKKRNFVELKWGKTQVLLNTQKLDQSLAYKDGQPISGKKKDELVQTAWKDFCNDSYWLVAPYKVFDHGTKRAVIDSNQLFVKYTSGGVTPGDAYLWQLNEKNMPVSFKMWVSVIPIGGLKATWEGWHETETGALLPSSHRILLFSFSIENIHTSNNLKTLGLNEDPFVALENE